MIISDIPLNLKYNPTVKLLYYEDNVKGQKCYFVRSEITSQDSISVRSATGHKYTDVQYCELLF